MKADDWIDLVIAGLVAALLTFLEIDRKFRFPEAIKKRRALNLWWWGFVAGNAILAALLYPLAIQVDWIHKMPYVIRGAFIGVGYLSIVRQKFMTAPSKQSDDDGSPVGIEYVYDSVKKTVHEHINRIAIAERTAAVKAKIKETSLEQLSLDARIRIQNDVLLGADGKKEALTWLVSVMSDGGTKDDAKAVFIATYVLFGER
jgi:hypothetical protein